MHERSQESGDQKVRRAGGQDAQEGRAENGQQGARAGRVFKCGWEVRDGKAGKEKRNSGMECVDAEQRPHKRREFFCSQSATVPIAKAMQSQSPPYARDRSQSHRGQAFEQNRNQGGVKE